LNQHDLTIAFTIHKSLSSTTNPGTISVYNLSEGQRNMMGYEMDDVKLEAGYLGLDGGKGNVGIIHWGQIRDIFHKREKADIVTELYVGDGDKGVRTAVVNTAYKANTPVRDMVMDAVSSFQAGGVAAGEIKLPDNIPIMKRPYAMIGGSKDNLDLLARSYGFYWSIQNNALEIVPQDGALSGMVLIAPETGLVGTPTITDKGVKAVALLNPEVRPGREFMVKSALLSTNAAGGTYRCSEAIFAGDNRSGDFTVTVTGERMTGGKVDEGRVSNLRIQSFQPMRGDGESGGV
jgi:hypothetical protein